MFALADKSAVITETSVSACTLPPIFGIVIGFSFCCIAGTGGVELLFCSFSFIELPFGVLLFTEGALILEVWDESKIVPTTGVGEITVVIICSFNVLAVVFFVNWKELVDGLFEMELLLPKRVPRTGLVTDTCDAWPE